MVFRRRLLVAQPSSSCQDGAGILQVGLLRWMLPPREDPDTGLRFDARPALSVIAKVTYSFAACSSPEEAMMLADEPEGLALDLPSELMGAEQGASGEREGEIAYPSDFIPMKPHCDVLLYGHAHSARPSQHIAASIEVGEVLRRFIVEAQRPSQTAPLVRAAIRTEDGRAPAPHVGPRPTPPLQEAYPDRFDFSVYAAAHASQRARVSPLGERLTLRGLSARAEERVLRVPGVLPAAFLDRPNKRGLPLEMWCDTLWIDTDRELLVLVFRGVLPVPSLDAPEIEQITLALAPIDDLPTWPDVLRDLDRGAFEPAAELSDFDEDAGPDLADEEAALGRYATWAETKAPSISLETYALISAALAEGGEGRTETLRRHGFDEDAWMLEERGWLTRMADAATQGDTQPAARYGELFVEAQDKLAGAGEGQESVEEYAALKADIEAADDPASVLEERKMTLAAWLRMDRRWTRRAMDDQALEAEIERHTQQCRARRAAEASADEGPGVEGGS